MGQGDMPVTMTKAKAAQSCDSISDPHGSPAEEQYTQKGFPDACPLRVQPVATTKMFET